MKGAARQRLDQRVVAEGLYPSREAARRAIMAGEVRIGDVPATKPGTWVKDDQQVRRVGEAMPWVSRGGFKLDHALGLWPIAVADRVAVDVGASTGGFTDVLLQRGAARVHAVDVGYGQLAWKLRQDPRVVVHERTNARHLGAADLVGEGPPVTLAVMDVSFIGLAKVLPAVRGWLEAGPAGSDREVVALVKPQFEVGPERVGSRGVVRDPAHREEALGAVVREAEALGFVCRGVTTSPITGPEGNVEYLLWLAL